MRPMQNMYSCVLFRTKENQYLHVKITLADIPACISTLYLLYLHYIYAISTVYLRYIYILSTVYLRDIYIISTLYLRYIYFIYSISTQISTDHVHEMVERHLQRDVDHVMRVGGGQHIVACRVVTEQVHR